MSQFSIGFMDTNAILTLREDTDIYENHLSCKISERNIPKLLGY
jgi:hypothetical protein